MLTRKTVPEVLKAAEESINVVVDDVSKLSQAASKLPYYKFNNMWSRQMQNAVGPLAPVVGTRILLTVS